MDLNEVSNEAISCIARARQVSGILVKSLSANDTGMTASHQVGLLVYSSAGRELFPFLDGNKGIDEAEIDIVWTVSGDRTISKAKWYSSKGEYRITGSI
ncbi:MAG: EcoRII N-terminal effector-binding domain-containing protein, partial [Ancrocorticia sp.]|uniref:EcoRII N-terminal effector-binding domain-containing protein n=1 Tax=Ancrocorticia sp. TaxID=2593684 RepID=UPI003F924F64